MPEDAASKPLWQPSRAGNISTGLCSVARYGNGVITVCVDQRVRPYRQQWPPMYENAPETE